jgi:hypothetical protein
MIKAIAFCGRITPEFKTQRDESSSDEVDTASDACRREDFGTGLIKSPAIHASDFSQCGHQ